ncbi:MAG TPA: IgGFc-binding protein, partial [Candidatus Kapabacteria bacterium]
MVKKAKYLLMMLVAAYAVTGTLYAQSSSTIGTEFWFGFMPNKKGPSDRITLVASSLTPATIVVESYLGDSTSIRSDVYHLTPTNFNDTIGSMTIELNPIVSETRNYETPVYRSVRVSSNAPISLSAYNYKRGSGEGMLVLPVTTYGKEYRTLNYPTFRETNGEKFSGQFMIISPFDNNIVTIKTKAYTQDSSGVETHAPETSWQVQLQKGQTYLVRSSTKEGTNNNIDLTGSHITSTRPVAVVSGHQYSKLDAPFGSTFFEMLPPVESWSKRYYCSNYDGVRKSTVVIVAADSGKFWFTSERESTPFDMVPGQRVEVEIFVEDLGMYIVSSSNSRFLAYELRRSKDNSNGLKDFPPVMTLVTSPNDRDNKDSMFIMNYPPIFDSIFNSSPDVAEETIYEGKIVDLTSLFKEPKAPALLPVPSQYPNYFYRTSSGYTETHTKSFYNRAPVTAMMTGTNGWAGFGHTGSLRYTKRSTDQKVPYITANSSYCGNYDILVTDDVVSSPFTVESGMLASVRVITKDHDITMLPASRNYRVVRTNDFTFGSQKDNFKLEVINPQLDAFAAVYLEDLSGNDTTYIFTYTAGRTPLSLLKGTGNKIPVGKQVCITLPLFPKADSSSVPVRIESVRLKSGLSNPTLQSVSPALPATFGIGDTLFVTICAYAENISFFASDSLLVFADCFERSFPVNIKGETGLLLATDASICNKYQPNQTYSSFIELRNRGELPLAITSYSIEGKNKDKFWI